MLDYIVVGAGVSGLACARILRRSGLKGVILEGRDRLGGRVWTDKSLGPAVDLGASWIHGLHPKNPLYPYAIKTKWRRVETSTLDITAFDAAGRIIAPEDLEMARLWADEFLDMAQSWQEKQKRDYSLRWGVDLAIKKLQQTGEKIPPSLLQLVNWYYSRIETDIAADNDKLSLTHWDHDEGCPGGNHLMLDGYQDLVQELALKSEVKFGTVVKSVRWGQQDGIELQSTTGTLWQAKNCIITVPLGVLKSNQISFSPSLPEKKREAIQGTSMGLLNKVVLKFPQVFWPQEKDFFGYVPLQAGPYPLFLNLAKWHSSPCLVALIGAQAARERENWNLPKVVGEIKQILGKIFKVKVPDPVQVLRTQWGQDPMSWGSYSHIPVGGTPRLYDDLASPAGNGLYFAGEGTSRKFPGTVHGALATGERAARQCLRKDRA